MQRRTNMSSLTRERAMTLTTFRHAWEGACLTVKISNLRFHDLRTFATRLRAKGVHEMDIMSLLGHTTLQMTSRYSHAMPENLRTAVDSLTRAPAVSSGSGSEPSLTVGLLPRSYRPDPG